MSPQPAADSARLFFALWPSDDIRNALARYADEWQWPSTAARVPAENFHVTLHFLGNVSRSRLTELQQLHLDVAPFNLRFGYPEVWQHGIAVLRPYATFPALSQLHTSLATATCDLGLSADRRDYRPHVTLARRAMTATVPHERPEIEWPVEYFVLVESKSDPKPVYTVLAEYPCSGNAEAYQSLTAR